MKKLIVYSFIMLTGIMVNAANANLGGADLVSKEMHTQDLNDLWVEVLNLNKTVKDVPESVIKYAEENYARVAVDIDTGLSRGTNGGGFARQYREIWVSKEPKIFAPI